MKKIILTISLLLLVIATFPDRYITRGPNPGEIYFLGPTVTGEGLYYSTDYGMTAVCVDSILPDGIIISAGITSGIIYYLTLQQGLYFSNDYGNFSSWVFRQSGIKYPINSGLMDGHIYSSFSKHSEDYGVTFINHNYTGFFGNKKDVEIDNQNNTGYVVVNKSGVPDSLYLLISNDNFVNLTIQRKFNMGSSNVVRLSRGKEVGELYLLNRNLRKLYYSSDFGITWSENNFFNNDMEIDDIIGGKTDGEVYILYRFVNMMWQNAHTYILHSSDYGITYEVYHPFAKGQEPLIANFSAKVEDKEVLGIKDNDSAYYVTGDMPLNVQFYNYSIGDINLYEWDFNNDGTIDSNEENPVYTYADTGWYSVNLTVYDDYDTNSFLRENYVYIYELTGTENTFTKEGLKCYPNPFSELITITVPINQVKGTNKLLIYNNGGQLIKMLESKEQETLWNGTDNSGNKCPPGIYYIALNNGKYSGKVLLTY